MILEIKNLSFYYGENPVLKGIDLSVGEKDRIGIIGHNGCGKTTLLRIITGELQQDSGDVNLSGGATMGYLSQSAKMDPQRSVLEEMRTAGGAAVMLKRLHELELNMKSDETLLSEYEAIRQRFESIDGYNMEHNIARILLGMDFPKESWEKRTAVLSGGEKTRLSLAKILIMSPDLLVLDEPTNHLDMKTIEWLESFLGRYRGAVILVSHDRWFLDRVTNRTVEISNGKSYSFSGSYTDYSKKRAAQLERQRREYRERRKTAEKLQDYAERNIARASTSNMAKSRLKMLSRIDLTEPERTEHDDILFSIVPESEPYKDVLTFRNVGYRIRERTLFSGLNGALLRGERLSIIGDNGTGKTTLLRLISGELRASEGAVLRGPGIRMSILSQNLFAVSAKDPLSYIWDLYPQMDQLSIRKLLASVGFRGEEVFTDASGLSGGELVRLNLARISLEHPNLLLLDEPTNHLDIETREVLEEALQNYNGTLIAVTHDRYFASRIGGKVLRISGGKAEFFENLEAARAVFQTQPERAFTAHGAETVPRPADSQKQARRERAKRREEQARIDRELERLETRISELEAQSIQPEVIRDHLKLAEICKDLEQAKEKLTDVENQWLEMNTEV